MLSPKTPAHSASERSRWVRSAFNSTGTRVLSGNGLFPQDGLFASQLENVQSDLKAQDWASRYAWIVEELEGGNASAVARKLNTRPQTVLNLVNGATPSGDTLLATLHAYPSISAGWLVAGELPRERTTPTQAERILAAIEGLLEGARDARRRPGSTGEAGDPSAGSGGALKAAEASARSRALGSRPQKRKGRKKA